MVSIRGVLCGLLFTTTTLVTQSGEAKPVRETTRFHGHVAGAYFDQFTQLDAATGCGVASHLTVELHAGAAHDPAFALAFVSHSNTCTGEESGGSGYANVNGFSTNGVSGAALTATLPIQNWDGTTGSIALNLTWQASGQPVRRSIVNENDYGGISIRTRSTANTRDATASGTALFGAENLGGSTSDAYLQQTADSTVRITRM